MKTISKQCNKVEQDVFFQEVLKVRGQTIKVKIRSNPYDFQSHARVYRWDGNQWQLVHNILPTNMKTPHGLSNGHHDDMEADFKADRDELLRVAKEILDVQ